MNNGTTTTTQSNKDGQAQTQPTTGSSSKSGAALSVSSDGEDSNFGDDVVHDLSGVVRRKNHNNKDGDGGSFKSHFPKPATDGVPQPGSSKPPHHHHHHHNHPTKVSSSTHSQHRLLCTLSAHTGSSVLAVRFSHSGRYLASAGDDAVVCVYAQQHLHKNGSTGGATATGRLCSER